MPIQQFPPHAFADENGLLAIGGDLHPDSLLLAYRNGIFPWPMPGLELVDRDLLWFSPPERAILRFEDLHIPRSLARARKKSGLHFSFDRAFEQVIEHCSQVPRPGQDATWITDSLKAAYLRLHRLGHAHSCEAWSEDRLVGGIYGVDADGAFAAESMFYLEPYASKLALLALIDHLRSRGAEWLDIQMMTPHLEALGASLISREQFLRLLAETRSRKLRLFPAGST